MPRRFYAMQVDRDNSESVHVFSAESDRSHWIENGKTGETENGLPQARLAIPRERAVKAVRLIRHSLTLLLRELAVTSLVFEPWRWDGDDYAVMVTAPQLSARMIVHTVEGLPLDGM